MIRSLCVAVLASTLLTWASHPALATLTGFWTGEGNQTEAWFGFSVSSAGDLNGDGYSDVVVGATQYDATLMDEGRVSIYYGGSGAMSATATTIDGGLPGIRFGYSVSAAGDLNGDGIDDLVVSTPYYDRVAPFGGAVFVFFGSAAGVATTPDQILLAPTGATSNGFGVQVANAGDVDADGYDDIIVGESLEFDSQNTQGAAYVYLGGPAGLPSAPDWSVSGPSSPSNFGVAVSGLDDVNGDGRRGGS